MAAQLKLKDSQGALVADIVPSGPADKAGIHKDDVIVSLNEKTVDPRSLRLPTALLTPNEKVDLGVIHAGVERSVALNLGTMPKETAQAANEGRPEASPRRRP